MYCKNAKCKISPETPLTNKVFFIKFSSFLANLMLITTHGNIEPMHHLQRKEEHSYFVVLKVVVGFRLTQYPPPPFLADRLP